MTTCRGLWVHSEAVNAFCNVSVLLKSPSIRFFGAFFFVNATVGGLDLEQRVQADEGQEQGTHGDTREDETSSSVARHTVLTVWYSSSALVDFVTFCR